MSNVYGTEDLIQILADERQACIRGQRLNLTASPTGFNPLLDRFLKTDGIQKFTAYHDFRTTIHRYQQEHQISGIVWHQLTLKGHTLSYPKVDDQLIALESDIAILKSAKPSILAFWVDVTQGMDLYLSVNLGKDSRAITPIDVERLAQRTEWASIWKQRDANCLEVVLQVGWGKPEEALYRRGWPDSGSEYVHAVDPGYHPIH